MESRSSRLNIYLVHHTSWKHDLVRVLIHISELLTSFLSSDDADDTEAHSQSILHSSHTRFRGRHVQTTYLLDSDQLRLGRCYLFCPWLRVSGIQVLVEPTQRSWANHRRFRGIP